MSHPLYVVASFTLFFALIACGISFFGPFWIGNVLKPGISGSQIESNLSYIVPPSAHYQQTDYTWRGLWAQCSSVCQWFWANDFSLQNNKFTELKWHLSAQVLYIVGAFLVLLCEIISRCQLCCEGYPAVYRSLGFTLLTSFVIQAAAIAVFGGFANRDYGATPFVNDTTSYLGWCFWMAVAGGGLSLIAGVLFLLMDCVEDYYYEDEK